MLVFIQITGRLPSRPVSTESSDDASDPSFTKEDKLWIAKSDLMKNGPLTLGSVP